GLARRPAPRARVGAPRDARRAVRARGGRGARCRAPRGGAGAARAGGGAVRRIALARAGVLALASPACADHPGPKPKEAVGFLLLCLTAFPIATFLPGLAFHLVLRALAPRRMRSVTTEVEQHVVRTFAFGLVDSGVLFLIFAATAQKAPPIAALV